MNAVTKTRSLMITAFASMLAMLTVAANAYADTTMKWCTTWKSTYVDAGFGEDIFTSSSPSYRAAQYTRAQVTIYSTGEKIWDGVLNASGCTPDLPVLSNTKYRIWQWTKAERGTRKIFVIPDPPWAPVGTWPDEGAVGIYWDYTTAWFLPDQHATYTKQLNWESPKANLMPIAGRVLGLYNTLAYPTGTKTHVRTDSDTCDTYGGAWCIGSHICVNGDVPGWEDATTWKYIFAHEMGHRVSNANDGPSPDGYDHSGAPTLCNCDHIEDYGGDLHCLGSREPILAAAGEGFAHFFASAVFNYRTENNGKFVYGKEAWALIGDLWLPCDPPTVWNAYQVLPDNWSDRWMEKYCSDDMTDKGVELDWLHFLYEMWTTGTYKFSVAKLADVWNGAAGSDWDDLLTEVGDTYGNPSGERTLFLQKGEQAGVDH